MIDNFLCIFVYEFDYADAGSLIYSSRGRLMAFMLKGRNPELPDAGLQAALLLSPASNAHSGLDFELKITGIKADVLPGNAFAGPGFRR